MAKDFWQNNILNKILNEKYKHDFSLCDADGLVRHNVTIKDEENDVIIKRLVMYEAKFYNEDATQTQLETLWDIDDAMNWSKFDLGSGMFLIKIYPEMENITMCKIVKHYEYFGKPYYSVVEVLDTTVQEFYNFITHRKNEIEERFIGKTFTRNFNKEKNGRQDNK